MVVRWKGRLSRSSTIDMGVPQGSVAAPLLFILLLGDVGKGVRKDTVVTAYADDIALWRKARHRRPKKDSDQHKSELRLFQRHADLVMTQLTDLGFMLSAAKTVYMPVHGIGYNRGDYPDWNYIKVDGTPIYPAKAVRYLGVIFQRDGKWTSHINQVIINARRALNLVQVIFREPWGQRRETLISIVKGSVRSRLLFGSAAMHDLPPGVVYRLARVECQALRLGLGLPASVPHEQVYNEAGALPLWYQLKKDACKYLFTSAKVANSTDEELREDWLPASQTTHIQDLPGSVQDLDIPDLGSVKNLCIKAGLPPDARQLVTQCQVDLFHPWVLKPPTVVSEIPGLRYQDGPYLLLAHVREMIRTEYKEDFLVYTDGSVLEDGRTGAGIFLENTQESISVKLPPTSIFSAELIAIREAIKIVLALPHPPASITVLSDSRTSLKALQSCQCDSQPDTLQEVLHLTAEASNKAIQIRYQWVLSHVGLHSNEKADGAAKMGALAPEEDMISIQFTVSDALHKINRAIWETWKADFTATAIARGWPTTTCHGGKTPTFPSVPPIC
ncbi:uncharacterized protein LOC143036179 [Oratosquilla oratoria]|uniref:uncharacterized protein LOC143036179 n=1 Tax=Oratosquilla oratoria TaxID=337810 RepID=UPI003F775FF7